MADFSTKADELFTSVWSAVSNFFVSIWEKLVSYYNIYFDYVHSIFPDKLGDFVVYFVNLAVIVLIVWLVAKAAFRTKGN